MAQDILMDIDNDLQIADGDFIVGDSGDMHIQHILEAYPGQFYQSPLVGVGIKKYYGSPFDRVDLARKIREQLQNDRFNIRRMSLTPNNDAIEIDIDATLKDNTAI